MSRRTDMIASQLRAEVARLLREEVMDPRVRLVTLTRVDVSPDLSNAVVYYSVMGDDDADTIEAVDDASGKITVLIEIFGRSTPVELEYWQVEKV